MADRNTSPSPWRSQSTRDSRVFEELVDAVGPVMRPGRGRTAQGAEKLHADKGYDFGNCREALHQRGTIPRTGRRGLDSSERLRWCRWVAERAEAAALRCLARESTRGKSVLWCDGRHGAELGVLRTGEYAADRRFAVECTQTDGQDNASCGPMGTTAPVGGSLRAGPPGWCCCRRRGSSHPHTLPTTSAPQRSVG